MSNSLWLADTNPPVGFNTEDVTPPPLPQGQWRVSSLALDISGCCNLACRYCAESASQPKRQPMQPEIIDAAFKFLFPDGKFKKNASIRFGSGEPMLALPLLRRVETLIQSMSKHSDGIKPEVFITSNGTLIDIPTADWLASTGWHVKISIDGPQPIHDAWRVAKDNSGTYATIAPIASHMAKKMKDKFSVTAVLCRGTDPQQVFDGIAKLGVKRIELVPVVSHDESIMPNSSDIELYRQFVFNYAKRYVESNKKTPSLVRFEGRISRIMGYNNSRIPCGAGRSFLAVDADGNLYPCFRFAGIEAYKLGNINSGVDKEAATAFHNGAGRAYEKRYRCDGCWAAPLCGGPCFSCSELFGKGDGEPLDVHCAYTLADAQAAVWLVEELRRLTPKRLLSFLPEVARIL